MKIVVLKFGGTSVGTTERIKKVANIIVGYVRKRFRVIVVSSAMSGVTNNLIKKSRNISNNFKSSEYDVLVAAGEQMSCALIAGRLNHIGYKSQSWISWQIPILTEGQHRSSRISNINKKKILNYLKSGGIPIITGFQGVNNNNRITTLGRGGSDASAIMCAKFFKAKKCVIFTDVEGVYTTDPSNLKNAKKIKAISYEEMLEMASLGAKVMQPHSIQDARLNRVEIEVKSSFINRKGTLITKRKNIFRNRTITGLTSTKNDAKVTLVGVKDRPGVAATVFKPLSQNYINVDMVVQTSSSNNRETDITFTIKLEDLSKTLRLIKLNKKIKYRDLIVNKNVSKISIIGVGMVTTPGVTYRMFQTLANKGINILVIATSEIKISVLINKKNIKKAISALHKEFKLNK
ncbi:MAG TPA: aspartate kinase [Candidatus Pelagibacter bacterium]|jgi:aspartate kinase|nr:aspartate kinase [Pelagibacteraceae bacterium]HJN84450.1 aspartate kinase [Candidatus Pelagibacter bacterium]|tara:strand:+ start:499 stop:1713 length:1215 start_codon:yes stop_codon:yes gene_type:complete